MAAVRGSGFTGGVRARFILTKTLVDPVQEGAGLVKARPDGVYLERVTYFGPME